ncbi:MAG: PQQ-binding-like beta-propeller repeat protein [Planctomycetes bacterium]|nr:PQQ-binding-like beta-propeller repeat protein [Planctomycetota bacterium]
MTKLWSHIPESRSSHAALAARSGDVLGGDAEGRLWSLEAAGGTIRWRTSVVAPVRALAISSDGRRAYVLGSRGHFAMLDEKGAVVRQEKLQPEVSLMDLEPAEQFVLFSDGVSTTWLRDLRTHQMQRRALASEVASLRLIPVRNDLVALLTSGTAAVLPLEGGLPKRIRGDTSLVAVDVAAHGNLIAFAAGSAGVFLTDGVGNETARFMLDDGSAVLHIGCDAAGERLAVADNRGRVLLLDRDGRILWHRPAEASGPVSGLRLTGNGERLLVIAGDGALWMYDLAAGGASATSSGAAPTAHSNAPGGARRASVEGERGPLWTIPAFGGIRSNYLGAAAVSPDAGLVGFLDRERREARLYDRRGTLLSSARADGTDLAIAFIDAEHLVVTGSEGVLLLTPSTKGASMQKAPRDSFTGMALAPGVPFALAWTSLGTAVAQEWTGAARWSGSAGGSRITHGALTPQRAWIVNAAGAVAELGPDGKLLSKSTPLSAPPAAAAGWGNFLALGAGREVLVIAPGGKTFRTLKCRGTVAALHVLGDHLLVRDAQDRLTMYNLVGLEEASGGPWPGRWAVAESAEFGGIVLLQAEVDILTCHRPGGAGVAWRVKMEEPIVDVEASADGRFGVVLDGPRMSLWPIGSATLPEARESYLEL